MPGFGSLSSDIASDSLNDQYVSYDDQASEHPVEEESVIETEDAAIEPPRPVTGDERRMQVRAYNFWTSQLGEEQFPSVEDLDPSSEEDFAEYSVLLDFTSGIENPSLSYIGEKLRMECGLEAETTYLDQVPARSLLSRITDHYLQIIANRAPIGFEAEFINEAGKNIMYRGILLPYSSDFDTIDFIYGVINWKEGAEEVVSDELQLEVEQAISQPAPKRNVEQPIWAEGPTSGLLSAEHEQSYDSHAGQNAPHHPRQNDGYSHDADNAYDVLEEILDEQSSLADWLHGARMFADNAKGADQRSRDALYQAIGRAYDFSLVAALHDDDLKEMLEDAGIKQQARAPMTPIVKLIFGADYDKTRITEFSAALEFGHRNAVQMGAMGGFISGYEGGLKGILKAERMARKVARGGHIAPQKTDPRAKLRTARARNLSEFAGSGDEFILLVARRDDLGELSLVGAVEADQNLTEKALENTITD
ncbi:hypothetical protein LPB140_03730 [Sphingorhabdus lutea]|uniref:Uncharacterized protein n=2 Tax=Sphingorhabdus lutea TaxID=1913578 RepID=A0A1L3JER2_9SPHN|nr:hypothetical protein LPB140_03730 [Sphingorhabdus lutea]